IHYLVEDAGAGAVITSGKYAHLFSDYPGGVFNVEAAGGLSAYPTSNPAGVSKATDLAYVLYTSGSTGNPKGCQIGHGNISNYVAWANAYYFGDWKGGNFGLYSSLSFDFTLTSIFCSLTRGKQLFIHPEGEEISDVLWHSFFPGSGIDVIKVTPAHISILPNLAFYGTGIRKVIVGGEELTRKHVEMLKEIAGDIEIYNEYGPTETTIGCTVQKVEGADEKILIGRPVAHTQVFLLDDARRLVPAGVKGEIVVGGACVGQGYIHDPARTREKFIDNPYGEGKLYLTGDLGRWTADGELEYHGRKDHQVKVRGYRIETGEVEHAMLKHPLVKAGLVDVRVEKEQPCLVAYYQSERQLDESALRDFLAAELPAYMVPAYFLEVNDFPLTTAGKINRKALPGPEEIMRNRQANERPPATEVERQLLAIWEEVLEVERIGVTEDFFKLGGHSLKAIQLVTRIHKVLGVKIELTEILKNTTVEQLAGAIAAGQATGFAGIVPVEKREYYDLSHAQKRLWLLSQLQEVSTAFNIVSGYTITGDLRVDAFKKAFDGLVRRHESLRTTFVSVEGEPKQRVAPADEVDFQLAYTDARADRAGEEKVKAAAERELQTPMDLENGPLLRAKLVRLADDKHFFLFTMHHIVSDAWSTEVIIREVYDAYRAITRGETGLPAELPVQYKDFVYWQKNLLDGEAIQRQRHFWLKELAGKLPVLDLSSEPYRPKTKTYKGGTLTAALDPALTQRIKAFSRSHDATLFVTLLASVKTLLYKYTGQRDLIVGTTVAGRDHQDLEDQVGFYVNVLALRSSLAGDQSFGSLVGMVKEKVVACLNNQAYPFDKLLEDIEWRRDMSRSPVFDVLVELLNVDARQDLAQLDDLSIAGYPFENQVSKYDLSFRFKEEGEALVAFVEYNGDLFTPARIAQLFNHYQALLRSMMGNPEASLDALEYLEGEKDLLLNAFNDTAADFGACRLFHQLFEAQVRNTPDATAVEYEGQRLSYRALNEQSNRLAHHLRNAFGVTPDERVGVLADKSERLIVALLAVLKSGAAFVPIEPAYPAERKKYILQDAAVKVLLTDSDFLGDLYFYPGHLVAMDVELPLLAGNAHNPDPVNAAGDLAYVIYTSGSTGNPKGVEVRHNGFSNYVRWANAYYFNNQGGKPFALCTSIAFDLTFTSIFTTLLRGDAVVVYPTGEMADTLRAVFGAESRARAVKLTPSHINLLRVL
ncbi:MAG: AMP-binding protein, partial [Cytophagales bacterium]|nr:AMP-binding protein [Cytophagales bacterium]